MKKNRIVLVVAFLINAITFAQTIKKPSSAGIKTALDTESSIWINIINIIIGIVIFGGLISVVHGIISKKEMSKAFVGSWVLALAIWILAQTFLGI